MKNTPIPQALAMTLFGLIIGVFFVILPVHADSIILNLPDNVKGGHIRYQDAFSTFGALNSLSTGTLGTFGFWPLDPNQTNGGNIPVTITLRGYSDVGCSSLLWTEASSTNITIPVASSTYPVLVDFSGNFRSLIGTQCIGGQVLSNYSSNAIAYWENDTTNGFAFVVTDQNANYISLQPQVYNFNTPTQFSVTSSITPLVGFRYLNTNIYDEVGVEVTDQTNNKLATITGIQSAIPNANSPYSAVLGLTANHAYRIRGVLLSSVSSTTPTYGNYVDFSTISDQYFSTSSPLLNINNVNENNAATSTSEGLSGFTFIPQYFAERVPFGYIYVIYNTWTSVATSSSQFGSLGINFSSLNLSTTTKAWLPPSITFFSTTTVTTYLTDNQLLLLNSLASATIAITWAMELYRRSRKIIKPV